MSAAQLFYSGYGLTVAADRVIPGLARESARLQADVQMIFDDPSPIAELDVTQSPHYTSPYLDEDGRPGLIVTLHEDGAYYRFLYSDDAEYILDRSGDRVWVQCPPAMTERDVFSYLLGPVMGFLLRLRGLVCLHASAVVIEDRAVAFVGPMGAGKSTTAMAMAGRGFPVLSDDVVPLTLQDDRVIALPGYPRMRLRPSAQRLLAKADPMLRGIPTAADGSRLHLELHAYGYQFHSSPLPLAAVFLLSDRGRDDEVPRTSTLPRRQALMDLVANTFATRLLDITMRAEEFELLGRLVDTVPVLRLHAHEAPAQLPALCETVAIEASDLMSSDSCLSSIESSVFA